MPLPPAGRYLTATLVLLVTASVARPAQVSASSASDADTVQLRRTLTIEASDRCLMERVVAIEMTTTGQLFVADQRASQICHYDKTGRLIQVIGRKGAGPGEFTSLAWLARLPGDTIVAFDGMIMRLSLFAPTGKLARTVQLTLPPDAHSRSITAFAVLPNGRLLLGFSDVQRLPPAKTAVPFTQSFYLFDTAGKLISAAGQGFESEHFVQTVPMRFGGTAYWDLAFGRRAFVSAGWGSAFAYVDGASPNVKLMDASGRVTATLSTPIRQRAITPGDIAAYRAMEMIGTRDADRSIETLQLEEMPYPSSRPTFGGLFTSTGGALIAQEYLMPTDRKPVSRWYVWSSKDAAVRVLQADGNIRGMAASRDRLCGVEVDADELESVVCYALP